MNAVQYPLDEAYSTPLEELYNRLHANPDVGLTDAEAKERRAAFGKNSIQRKKRKSASLIFIAQFANPMVYMLLVAAGLSVFFKEWLDGIAILAVILINTVVGFLMEFRAERSMDALRRMTRVNSKVMRGGNVVQVPTSEIVPGDVLFLEAGDLVPADSRISKLAKFSVNESALTGESMPVEKQNQVLAKDTLLAERVNMVYKGTFVTNGNANALVTGIGMNTELGKIASMVQSAEQSVTPLEKKLEEFSKKLIKITLALVLLIFIVGILYGDPVVEMLKTSIALAVAAIPEGLPIVATLALAQGMLKMAKHHVIVKKLEAVETLGGTNVICTDKTGTLTQNKIEVNTVVTVEGRLEMKVDLSLRKTAFTSENKISESKSFELIKQIAVLCNTAELVLKNESIEEVGDPLETGLLKFAYCNGVDIQPFRNRFPKIKEEPFSSETRIMATMHKSGSKYFVAAKGAVEELIRHCSFVADKDEQKELDEAAKSKWITEAENLAGSGLRIIAAAYKEAVDSSADLTGSLVFAGLIGMLDPPAEEVFEAIRECKTVGIKVVMITGDHPATAKNIGLKLGLIDSENEKVMLGSEMHSYEDLTAAEKRSWIEAKIFARVSPAQKVDLVSVLQENKSVVGMTGDGVNDAPALKKADIGIAMGIRGTQVAQEVADMVLKDDSFSSIVLAIRQGRVIFENIRRFVVYLLSCNISELLVVSLAAVFNFHFGLFALQILYINLVTDVLPALALGVTKGSDSVMQQQPRNSGDPIIDRHRWKSIFVYAFVISACTFGSVLVTHILMHKSETWNPELCNNILFLTLILCQLLHVFNMSTENEKSFFRTDVFNNKYVWLAMGICLSITMAAYVIPEVSKVLFLYLPSRNDLLLVAGFGILSLLINRLLKRMKIIY